MSTDAERLIELARNLKAGAADVRRSQAEDDPTERLEGFLVRFTPDAADALAAALAAATAELREARKETAKAKEFQRRFALKVERMRHNAREQEAALACVKAEIERYDHSGEECKGDCVVERRTVAADFRAALASRVPQPGPKESM